MGKFDTITATDAYGSATFKCQLAPLELFKVDGVAVKKRQMSCLPTVTIPTRGAITIDGQTSLVGHGSPDYWKGTLVRMNYVIQGADGLANLITIGGALANTAPVTAYAAIAFSRYLPESADSSKYPPQFEVFLSGAEAAPAETLIQLNDQWYLVKQSYLSTSGLRVALVNDLNSPSFETITFGSQTYNPITDAYSGATTATKVLRVRWTEHYTYLSKASETYERGDQQVFMLKAVTPKPSDLLTLSDGVWRVLSVIDDGAVWSCHARRT